MKNSNIRRFAMVMSLAMILSTGTLHAEEPIDLIPPEVMGEMSFDLYNIHQMSNSMEKVRLFTEMAAEFHRNELVFESESLFEQSCLLASHLAKTTDRASAHLFIASTLEGLGETEKATNMIAVGLFEASKIWHDNKKKAEVYREAARIYGEMGKGVVSGSFYIQAKRLETGNIE